MRTAIRSFSSLTWTWIFLFLTAFILAACGGGGGGYSGTTPASSVKAITAYSLSGTPGTIDETNHRISVTLPQGTNVTTLAATFTTTGTSVTVGAVTQVSGTTANDFTSPVVYTVTAADGSTVNYTVSVFAIGDVVISEIYGVGGNASATYNQDFVELYNASTVAIDLSTWSLQYASVNGTTWIVTNLTGTIPASSYYLIAMGSPGANGVALPTPDLTSTQALGTIGGKLILSTTQAALPAVACPADPNTLDLVGYGPTVDCFAGTGAAPAFSSNAHSLARSPAWNQTQDNAADFANITPPTPGAP